MARNEARRTRDRREPVGPVDYGLPTALRDPSPVTQCSCGASYVDDPDGRRAHLVVFGHGPRPPGATTAAEDDEWPDEEPP